MSRPKRSPWEVQRSVVFALFIRELKTRFGGRWIGAFWVLLEPLAHVLMLLMIFGFVQHRVLAGVEYSVFLLVGLVPFFMFKNLVVRLMEAVDSNRGLFGYRQVKPLDPLISRALLEVTLYSVVYLIVLAVLGWFGFQFFPARPLELIGVSTLLILMGAGLGLIFAVTTNEVPQLCSFVRIAFMPLYLISGVIFPVSSLPPEVLSWLLWNPVLHALELSRGYFFPQYHVLHQVSLEYVAGVAIGAVALGMSLYRVRRDQLLAS